MVRKNNYLCRIIAFSMIILLSPAYGLSQVGDSAPKFELLIKCTLESDCFIMHYVDLDSGEAEVDYGCGRQTYNKHDGTDFGISDIEAMKRGIPVLAAAEGVVIGFGEMVSPTN